MESVCFRNGKTGKRKCEMLNVKLEDNNSTLHNQHSTLKKTVMFMGSSQKVLDLIVKRAAEVYPHLKVVTYSPPYKPEFSDEDNKSIH